MTTPHRTLQMALDALDAITDDVDGTGLNTMPSFDKAIDAIAALREALAPDHLRDGAEKVAPAAPVPDGWAMVPREPTPEMLAVVRNGPMHETWTEGYCAMIAASPAAPAAPVPLTKGQIDFILGDSFLAANGSVYSTRIYDFVRAIEAAHGITGGKP